jgi:hypothetical protein
MQLAVPHCCSHTPVLSFCSASLFLVVTSTVTLLWCTCRSRKFTTWHRVLNSRLHAPSIHSIRTEHCFTLRHFAPMHSTHYKTDSTTDRLHNSSLLFVSSCLFQYVLNRSFDISPTLYSPFWKFPWRKGEANLTYSCLQLMARKVDYTRLFQSQ